VLPVLPVLSVLSVLVKRGWPPPAPRARRPAPGSAVVPQPADRLPQLPRRVVDELVAAVADDVPPGDDGVAHVGGGGGIDGGLGAEPGRRPGGPDGVERE